MTQSPDPNLHIFTAERKMWLAAVLAAGLVGYSAGNGHTTQGAIAHVSAQLGDEKAEAAQVAKVAGCEKVRGNIAKDAAVESEQGANVDLSAIPNCPPLPKK